MTTRGMAPSGTESAAAAMADAMEATEANAGAVRWPLPALHRLAGRLAPGRVIVVTGATGNGKTTLLLETARTLALAGHGLAYLGTEQPPHELWRTMACALEGVPSGVGITDAWDDLGPADLDAIRRVRWALDGSRAPALDTPADLRAAVEHTETDLMAKLGPRLNILADPMPTPGRVRAACRRAVEDGHRLVVLDHLGRMLGDDADAQEYGARKAATSALVEIAKDEGVCLLVGVQQNRRERGGDHLGPYQPPKLVGLEGGGFIEQEAWACLGVWRPLREAGPGEDVKALHEARRAARAGEIEPREVLEPDTMAVVLLKHRGPPVGVRVGDRVRLRVRHGRITELDPQDAHAIHTGGVASRPRGWAA